MQPFLAAIFLLGLTLVNSFAQDESPLSIATKKSTTGWDQQKLIWWRSQFADIYRAHARERPPQPYDQAAYDLLERQAQRAAGLSEDRVEDQEQRARALRDQSCTDPLITYVLGLSLFNRQRYLEALPFLQEAADATIAAGDPPIRAFVVVERLLSCYQRLPQAKREKAQTEQYIDLLVTHTRRLFDSPDVVNPFASEVVYGGLPRWLRKRGGLSEAQRTRLQSQLLGYGADTWTRHLLEGKFALDQAWEAIGNDRRNLTDENRHIYQAHLDQAARSLSTAWEIDPRRPRAPTLMMTALLGQGEAVRKWFDRATAFYPDYPAAYLGYQRVLFPIWGGNQAALLALGREAAATKNYATGVPLKLLPAFLCVDADYQFQERSPDEFWQRPGVWDEVESVVNGYLTANTPAYPPGYIYSCLAIVAWRAGRFDQAQQALEKAGDNLYESPFREWLGASSASTIKAIREHLPPPKPTDFNDF